MPNYLSPGVYVEEVSGGVKPISGVGTSTGAFVGIAEKGVIGEAVLISNWSQFVREFGGFIPDGYLAYAVYGFFAEGGSSCYVVRTCHYSDILKPQSKTAKTAAVTLKDKAEAKTLRITAVSEGAWANKLVIRTEKASVGEGFKLSVVTVDPKTQEQTFQESFDELTLSGVEATVNNQSSLIRVEKDAWPEDGDQVIGSGNLPLLTTEQESETLQYHLDALTGGNNGLDAIGAWDFIGDANARNGLHAFDTVDNINIVAIPELPGNPDLIAAALNYCKNRKDCFYIADPPAGLSVMEVKGFKTFNSSYGALYYPWVEISDPLSGKRKKVPPSGVVAGTYAYTDTNRGVHKAPAGTVDGYLDSVVGLETLVTKGEHDLLNPAGINVIRSLPATGICIWGARTLSADPEWRYVNVRRLLLYIEESLEKGTQWVVFEPNDAALWGKVKRNLTAFLTRVWRDGALFGATADEAFQVKVDEENNPPEIRDVGQLIIEVKVAPVKPAEFVVIRVSQKTLTK